jgi:hypothetical protein
MTQLSGGVSSAAKALSWRYEKWRKRAFGKAAAATALARRRFWRA